MNNNICAEKNELTLEFEVRNSFEQLESLVNIANDVLNESQGFAMVNLRDKKFLSIRIFKAKNSHSSLTISATVRELPKTEILQITKFNFASAFSCKSKIEFVKPEASHKSKLRLVLTLPTEETLREQLEFQFSILEQGMTKA